MRKHKIAVAGHLCLDLHPDLKSLPANALITPGKVFEIGNLGIGTGGSVSNTGISLFKLGVDTQLLTCVGDDMVSQMILESIAAHHPILIENIKILENQHGSYTMVFSPENQDRTLIHYPGTNENFGIEHIDFELLNETSIFHLGYPPLLPRLVNEEGFELELLYSKVKESGVVTSLDLSLPDPHGNTSSADWEKILKRVLPFVEIILPSIEEIVFMLRKSDYLSWNGEVLPYLTKRYMEDLADEILELGAAVSGFK
ncbi:MAG: carbohydrate kinase family protein, partial [SAR324 cluster bacterium]|nr:carbohydrate kinase family protein [SAR324 cluster bacterium]